MATNPGPRRMGTKDRSPRPPSPDDPGGNQMTGKLKRPQRGSLPKRLSVWSAGDTDIEIARVPHHLARGTGGVGTGGSLRLLHPERSYVELVQKSDRWQLQHRPAHAAAVVNAGDVQELRIIRGSHRIQEQDPGIRAHEGS